MLIYSHQHLGNPAEEAFYRSVTDHSLKGLTSCPAGSVALRTSDLEEALETCTHALGIERNQETITNPRTLMALHPGCHHFIVADGAVGPSGHRRAPPAAHHGT